MTRRLEGTVALVTGAARGMGRAHAVALAGEGADLVLVDAAGPVSDVPYPHATPSDLEETSQLVQKLGRRVVTGIVDVRDLEGLRSLVGKAVDDLGRLDTIVANAGIVSPARWDQTTPEVFRDTIDVNVVGVWNTVMAGTPHIIAGGQGGSIILISSTAGLMAQPFTVGYTASKHAVIGLARAFAAELGRHKIRVNSLCPGTVDTYMGGTAVRSALTAASETNPILREMSHTFLPRRAMDPDEISRVVLFLASQETQYITGVALPVDGGLSLF